MACLHSRVYCEKNVIVDFFLAGYNVENMDVFIYHPRKVVNNCFDEAHSLIGIVIIRHDKIIFEFSPNVNSIRYKYYQIGLECVKRIQHYPKAILG